MKIDVIDRQSFLIIDDRNVKGVVEAVVDYEGYRCDEVAIFFVDIEEISDLHERFFSDPSPTDCISFPVGGREEGGYYLLGDVFICPEVAIEQAKEHDTGPYDEASLYLVHGLLHLMGYNDIMEDDRQRMRSAEGRNLENLKQRGYWLA